LSTFRLTRCVAGSIRADQDGQGSDAPCSALPTAWRRRRFRLWSGRPDCSRGRARSPGASSAWPGAESATRTPPAASLGKDPAGAFLFHPPAPALPAIYDRPGRDMASPRVRIGVQFRSRLRQRGGQKSWPISDARNRPLTPQFRQANHPQKPPCRFLSTSSVNGKNRVARCMV
jgi:hypothetical protein